MLLGGRTARQVFHTLPALAEAFEKFEPVSAAKRQGISARPLLDPAAAFFTSGSGRGDAEVTGVGPSSMTAATVHLLFAAKG